MTKNTIKAALENGQAVFNLNETGRDTLAPAEWHLLNLSGYEVSRAGNYLIIDARGAGELKDAYLHGASFHNSLFEEERIEFGKQHLAFLREKSINECEEFGEDILKSVQGWNYWKHNGLTPSKVDILKALCGQGSYADDMAEALTLGLLEDIARTLFDGNAEISLEDING